VSIQLTDDQSSILTSEMGAPLEVIDPQTRQTYRLVPEDVYRRLQSLVYDATPWGTDEMARLAGAAFSKLDNDDYSHYLRGTP